MLSQKITPYFWFNGKAEEAVNFYLSIFNNAKIINATRLEGIPGLDKPIFTATFQLEGQTFMALDGGPAYAFTPAISLFVSCTTQQEIDHYWNRLAEGGKLQQCGWLTDKYGMSWQIVPEILGKLLHHSDAEKSKRVMDAMLKMVKLDIQTLISAHDGH